MRFPAFLLILAATVLLMPDALSQRLSRLAPSPDWSRLEQFQQTITREDFQELLERVYAPNGVWKPWIQIAPDHALVTTREGKEPWKLRFAPSRAEAAAVPRYWRGRSELPPASDRKPLNGLRITIDPGHIGGEWAQMEERWFRIGESRPVTEGDMTLYVARMLKARLEQLGAKVTLTRSKPAPVTSDRPEKLVSAARASLRERGSNITERRLRLESEILFYRVSEIRARARLVNEKFKPDLVLCLHFNAEAWGNPARPSLVEANHLHFLILGAFGEEELTYEDQRFGMLLKLLNRSFPEELAATKAVADSMAEATGLPPFEYKSDVAVDVGGGPFIWGRNLLANRLFEAPVIFLEPYVMNNAEVFDRIQAGDYAGLRTVHGKKRPSIYREYADSVIDGILNYYRQR